MNVLGALAGAAGGFLTGGPIGAVAGGLGGLAGSVGAEHQQDFSAQQAQNQMDFQRQMSSTAYQRAVTDMRAAGLNPMLAYMQGGASSPQGAMSQGEDVVGAGVSTAMSAMNLVKQQKLLDWQIQTQKNQSEKVFNEAQLLGYEMARPGAAIGPDGKPLLPQTYWALNRQAEIDRAKAQAASARSQAHLNELDYPAAGTRGGKFFPYLQAGSSLIGGMSSAYRAAKGGGGLQITNRMWPK